MANLSNRTILGKNGENSAVNYLIKEGWDILAKNYKKVEGEIDIICSKEIILCFVEVKTWEKIPISNLEYSINDKKKAI